jgi:G3E family GTPase
MTSTRIAAYLVFGATGAGKSTAIARLIARRPPTEHWGVLVNDFGIAAVRDESLDGGIHRVTVREVAGCICCTSQVSVRTALINLVRDASPQRVLIEVSAAAYPGALMRLLREPGIARAVDVRGTLCVVDPFQILDSRYASLDVYREQIAAADCVSISKAHVSAEALHHDARTEIAKIRGQPATCAAWDQSFVERVLDL